MMVTRSTLKILFTFLVILAGEASALQKAPPVRFLVTGQSVSRRQHMFQFTKVNYKIVNSSKTTIVIYGLKREGVFEPTGDVVEFNKETNTWVYKTENKKPTQWDELPEERREELSLGPGQAIEFSEEYVNATGKRLRRSAFVSLKKDQPPINVETKAFVITAR